MAGRPAGPLSEPYAQLRIAARRDLKSAETNACLSSLIGVSLDFLKAQCTVVPLRSAVPGKDYFAYASRDLPTALSRPVNKALFIAQANAVVAQWKKWAHGSHEATGTERLSYTMGTAYAVASDLFDRNNKKGPATYFEILVGHLFAKSVGFNPTKRVEIPLPGSAVAMTMDFLFDVGSHCPRIHLPVKTSSRERVVQAWAHQRLLDAAYADTRYRGILVVHSETKLNLQSREVVEICVPGQWRAYQKFLSRMDRIYYFDTPARYAKLAADFPNEIPLKQFSAFFAEREALLKTALHGANCSGPA